MALTMAAMRRGSYPQVEPRAVDLMTPAVTVVEASLSVGAAQRLANRQRARLLVTREPAGRGFGWSGVTPDTLTHALALGLDQAPVAVALWRTPAVGSRTPEVLVRRRLRSGAPAALVVDGGRPLGAVLREVGFPRGLPGSLRVGLDRLSEAVRAFLREAARVAGEMNREVWLVGGLVRDLALGRIGGHGDLDLVVEGDARPVARRLAMRLGGQVREHPAFLTATVQAPGWPRIDLATARRERYARPGALPLVEPAPIGDDLWRRDFSINALALRLRPESWGEVLDPTGGLDDLAGRELRVLHPLSFVEDPTRCLRAIRFATRLDFHLDASTRRLLVEAARLDAYTALSADRLRAELGRVLAEPAPGAVLGRLGRLGALRLLGLDAPPVRESAAVLSRLFRRTRRLALAADTREKLAVLALTAASGSVTAERTGRRLGLPARSLAAIRQARASAPGLLERLDRAADPGDAYRVLDGAPEPAVAWALGLAPEGSAARHLARYLGRWRHARPLLGGEDLMALGLVPSPRFRDLLREARAAQASGRLRTRAGALRWLRRAIPPSPRATSRFTPSRSQADPQRKGGSV
jgi:tRNA nucleotidyltransferase (CCA-adding enzyme)